MQIMNFEKLVKKIKWIFNSSAVIKNFPDIIMFVSSDGYITEANKKALEYFNIGEHTVLNDIIPNGMRLVKDSVKFKKPVLVQSNIENKEVYFELNASKVKRNFCISIRNVTRLTNEVYKKEAVERFNGEKNIMLTKLESDFSSPLSSIIGFSQGLVDGIGGELTDKQAKYIKIINSNASELYHFIEKFIEFSYAESSIYEGEIKSFDIISAIKEILKPDENQKILINFEYEELEKRNVNIDIKAFQKAIADIVDVSKSMTESGSIMIRLCYPDEETKMAFGLDDYKTYLLLTVKDTGSGIAQEDMKYLCDPYAHLETSSKKNFLRSLKLGSASIFIKRLGGKISINSEVMQGTMYSVVIPTESSDNE
jgi:signal transduction histidine kinase